LKGATWGKGDDAIFVTSILSPSFGSCCFISIPVFIVLLFVLDEGSEEEGDVSAVSLISFLSSGPIFEFTSIGSLAEGGHFCTGFVIGTSIGTISLRSGFEAAAVFGRRSSSRCRFLLVEMAMLSVSFLDKEGTDSKRSLPLSSEQVEAVLSGRLSAFVDSGQRPCSR